MSARRDEGSRSAIGAGRARAGRGLAAATVLAACLGLGCPGGEAPAVRGPAQVQVEVASVTSLADRREYVGNVRAVDRVEIRARVRGYLVGQLFEDGARVEKGALLFRIDPVPFEVALAEAKGQLARARAEADRAERDLARTEALFESGVVSDERIDERRSTRDETAAAVDAARAAVKAAELELSYAAIRAPVAGRIGRALVDVGNLVGESNQDTILAVLVQEDPVHVYFAAPEGEAVPLLGEPAAIPVEIRLGDGSRYANEGVVDYVEPTVDATRGTLALRARVPNPEGVLRPGQFVRVVAEFPDVPKAIVVAQRAVLDEQGGSYVLIVGAEDKVERRPVRPGRMVEGRQEILEGLVGGERVVVDGVQGVRPGDVVAVESGTGKAAEAASGESSADG
ncbi:MAG: efflux RND transporter periplasmic adaptor subunit [Deltaproteobacteria bacterium]|nr:efflux RND transporter periplasmic adaptor subunit [Deltaproteobacteria bacterium]